MHDPNPNGRLGARHIFLLVGLLVLVGLFTFVTVSSKDRPSVEQGGISSSRTALSEEPSKIQDVRPLRTREGSPRAEAIHQVVHVRGAHGQRIRDAHVLLDGHEVVLTDVLGDAHIELSGEGVVHFQVIHPEHVSFSGSAHLPSEGRYVVTLSPLGRISGQVVDIHGLAIPDVHVFAIPSERLAIGWQSLLVESLKGTSTGDATSDHTGWFSFKPLDPQEEYTLVAAATCWIPATTHPRARQGDGPVTVVVQRFRIAQIRLEDESGGPPLSVGGISDSARISGWIKGNGTLLNPTPLVRELASHGQSLPAEFVYFADTPSSGDGESYIELSGQLPGYAPFSVSAPLLDCTDQQEAVTVVARRVAGGFGHVQVRRPELEATTKHSGSLGYIVMTSASGEVTLWPLSWDLAHEHALMVPYGEYKVRFESPSGIFPRFACQPDFLQVGPVQSHLSLRPIETSGRLVLQLAGQDRGPEHLDASVSAGHPTDGPRLARGTRVRVQGAPVIPWLEQGPYTVTVKAPAAFAGWTGFGELLPGQESVILLQEPAPSASR